MSLENYSDRQIIEEIERRLIDKECDTDITDTTIKNLRLELDSAQTKNNAAYNLIDFIEEFIVLSAFDNDEYHFYRDYKKARYGE